MVPGSTFKYGSIFSIPIFKLELFSKTPILDAVIPFPSELNTPPVTNIYFVLKLNSPYRIYVSVLFYRIGDSVCWANTNAETTSCAFVRNYFWIKKAIKTYCHLIASIFAYRAHNSLPSNTSGWFYIKLRGDIFFVFKAKNAFFASIYALIAVCAAIYREIQKNPIV
jgi:hypothetical protein